MMVLWSLNYINSWYTAALNQLATLQTFIQASGTQLQLL
jgi:hypothetical protein